MIALLRQVPNHGDCEGARWARMRIHRIASKAVTDLGYSSKLNAEWPFSTCCETRGADVRRRSCKRMLRTMAIDLPSILMCY